MKKYLLITTLLITLSTSIAIASVLDATSSDSSNSTYYPGSSCTSEGSVESFSDYEHGFCSALSGWLDSVFCGCFGN